jgi:hypothetical protein
MARRSLVTVPDEGAAWVVRDALAAGGVTAEVEPAGAEHPYATTALARPMRVWVPAEQLAHARNLLAALEEEIAGDEKDLSAQASAAGQVEAADAPARRSGYWFLYNLVLVVAMLMGAICWLGAAGVRSETQRRAFPSAWATVWAVLALVLTRTFGRRRIGRTILLNLLAALLSGAIAASTLVTAR